jgi:hypothetical protein
VIRTSIAVVNRRAVNEFLGMHQFFGGNASAALVENFAPSASTAINVAMDREPSLMCEFVVCQDCFLDKPLDMARLLEGDAQRRRLEEDAKASATT